MSIDTKTPYTDISARVAEILQRSQDKGTDISEEESAVVKRYFDLVDPETTYIGGVVAKQFPAEADEWMAEVKADEEPRLFARLRLNIESLDDDELDKELSFAEGFDDRSSPGTIFWLEGLRHEARCRGIFVPDVDTETIEEWMRDSDYLLCDDPDCNELGDGPCGWIDLDDQGPYDPNETYTYAHQAMTWADALERLVG